MFFWHWTVSKNCLSNIKKVASSRPTALHLQKFILATITILSHSGYEQFWKQITNLFCVNNISFFFSKVIFFCSTSKNPSTNRDWKTTNLLFFVCILHCLLMTPLIITNLISIELPTEIYAILYAVYLLQYVVNFLIYALGHRQYRKAYVYFLQNVKLSIQWVK